MMIEEDKKEDYPFSPCHDSSFLSRHEVLLEVLTKTFAEMDRKKVESCPPGCLAVLWPGERKER
jgi:hypothetical protein